MSAPHEFMHMLSKPHLNKPHEAQAPCPSHTCSQVPRPESGLAQSPSGSRPAVYGVQVPAWFGTLQLWHGLLQSALQHTASMQWVLAHSTPALHGLPFSLPSVVESFLTSGMLETSVPESVVAASLASGFDPSVLLDPPVPDPNSSPPEHAPKMFNPTAMNRNPVG